MPFNGQGVFTRSYSWQQDAANNLDVDAVRMDGEFDNFKGGLDKCLLRDGQSTVTANIPLNGFKFTGAAAGSASTDFATYGQLQAAAGVALTVVSSGTTTLTFSVLTNTIVIPNGTSSVVIKLPEIGGSPAVTSGASFKFVNLSNADATIERQGSDVFIPLAGVGGNLSTLTLKANQTVEFLSNASASWYMVEGSALFNMSNSSGVLGGTYSSVGKTYLQHHPSGMIKQGFSQAVNASGTTTVTYPVAFPNGSLGVGATYQFNGTPNSTGITCYSPSASQFVVNNTHNATVNVYFEAFGY